MVADPVQHARGRFGFVHDHLELYGGGEQMLARVATLARHHAPVDLGVVWRRPIGVPGAMLAPFDARYDFDFPLRVRPATARACWAASKRE